MVFFHVKASLLHGWPFVGPSGHYSVCLFIIPSNCLSLTTKLQNPSFIFSLQDPLCDLMLKHFNASLLYYKSSSSTSSSSSSSSSSLSSSSSSSFYCIFIHPDATLYRDGTYCSNFRTDIVSRSTSGTSADASDAPPHLSILMPRIRPWG